jgi:acetyl-CoA C-acetyltransferase
MNQVYICATARTPIGKFLGKLRSYSAPQLAAKVIGSLIGDLDLPIDAVILGHVLSAGVGQAPARQAALLGGLPNTIEAFSINKVCGSGLEAIITAFSKIKLQDAAIAIAGGMESMSNAPYLLEGYRIGKKLGNFESKDSLIYDGLWDSFNNAHMGEFADYTANKSGISREELDNYSVKSHRLVIAARALHHLDIIPLENEIVEDEGPRSDTSIEKLQALKPAFLADGKVTPGNSSPISDGAAGVILASEAAVKEYNLTPIVRIVGFATSGVPPKDIFFAPGLAIQKLLHCSGVTLNEVAIFEINEAFAAQVLANQRELKLIDECLNPLGGSIALGHPLGASGARVMVTLLRGLQVGAGGKGKYGVAALCLGGGNGVAMMVERL